MMKVKILHVLPRGRYGPNVGEPRNAVGFSLDIFSKLPKNHKIVRAPLMVLVFLASLNKYFKSKV